MLGMPQGLQGIHTDRTKQKTSSSYYTVWIFVISEVLTKDIIGILYRA